MFMQTHSTSRWDHLQEPRRRAHHSAAYLRLMAALDAGWRISSLAYTPPRPETAQHAELCFTLFHQERPESRTLKLLLCQELADFITNEQLPVSLNHTACD